MSQNVMIKKSGKNKTGFLLVGSLCFSIAVLANENDSASNSPDLLGSLETIQIRGIRGSIIQSIDTKRQAQGIVDAITAEEIGKFPDKNVAESLQRITGVSLNRVQGEGERVGVRGTAPSQNRTTINGQTIASADWWISAQPNRGFNYTLLPAEIVSSLEVHKSPQADHDEGSLGGSVSINTRKPLTTKDELLVGSLQWQHNQVSAKSDPQLAGLYNWIDDSEQFGVLVALIRHQRSLRRDGLESWGWTERNFNQTATGQLVETKAGDADLQGIWSAGGGGSAVFSQQRVLTSAMASIQYQPNNDWNLELHGLFSRLDADNNNQNFLWQPGEIYSQGGRIDDHAIADQTLVYAEFAASEQGNHTTAMESIWRESRIETSMLQWVAEQDVDYRHSEYQLGFTRASGGTGRDLTAKWAANSAYSVDLGEPRNIVAQYAVDPRQAENWQIVDVRDDAQDSTDQQFFVQTDHSWQLDRPLLQSVELGAKFKSHHRDFVRLRSRNGGLDGLAGVLDWSLADFNAPFVKGYLQGIGSEQTLKSYAMADVNALDDVFAELNFVQTEELSSRFDIVENSLAGYAKVNFATQGLKGNFGIRVVHTAQQAGAYAQVASRGGLLGDHLWSEQDKNYTDILPSLNIALDWTESLKFRLSASKVMSRPEYHHLMPSTNYNLTQAQGSGGNPSLDPFRASKFDLGFEWYFDEAALFSMMVFSQNVNSFIDIHRYQETYEQTEMVISRPVNGSGGQIYGAELSWQQELFYGFGVIANYTYVQGERKETETGRDIDIPGNSDHTANLTTYFENDWLGLRLSYNFRTQFATGVGEEVTDDFGQWDLNMTVQLDEHFSLVVEGINLTDEILYTYERNHFAPVGVYRNGRRLYAGVRAEF